MNINNEIEREFFKDMLANGIPITANFDFDVLCENLEDAASNVGDFDTILDKDMRKILISDKFGASVIAIRHEHSKLIFYSNSEDDVIENARLVGQLVFLVVSICSIHGFLSLATKPKTEESFDFDSDFV